MATIPKGDDESCKVYFCKMKNAFDKLKNGNSKNIKMKYLSMGMSNDYKIAIKKWLKHDKSWRKYIWKKKLR